MCGGAVFFLIDVFDEAEDVSECDSQAVGSVLKSTH